MRVWRIGETSAGSCERGVSGPRPASVGGAHGPLDAIPVRGALIRAPVFLANIRSRV